MNFESVNDQVQNTETGNVYTIAENCYVYELDPQLRRFNNSKKLFVKLNIFSMDKLMTLNKYSKAYVARKLGSGILKPESIKTLREMNFQRYFAKDPSRVLQQGIGQTLANEASATAYDMGVEGKSFTESAFGDKW